MVLLFSWALSITPLSTMAFLAAPLDALAPPDPLSVCHGQVFRRRFTLLPHTLCPAPRGVPPFNFCSQHAAADVSAAAADALVSALSVSGGFLPERVLVPRGRATCNGDVRSPVLPPPPLRGANRPECAEFLTACAAERSAASLTRWCQPHLVFGAG